MKEDNTLPVITMDNIEDIEESTLEHLSNGKGDDDNE